MLFKKKNPYAQIIEDDKSYFKLEAFHKATIVTAIAFVIIMPLLFFFMLGQAQATKNVIEPSETIAETSETVELIDDIAPLVEFSSIADSENVIEETIETTEPTAILDEITEVSNSSKTSQTYKKNTWDTYVGRFYINSVGFNVGCYASNSQATVDADDSAAYYCAQGHVIIADHTNQGFNAIKSCNKGTKASLSTPLGTKYYTCVAKINGINTGYGITDTSGNSISTLYDGTLVCYTCNSNWQDITIVFFEPDDGYNIYVDSDGNLSELNSSENEMFDSNTYFCDELGKEHKWGEWSIEWGADDGSFAWMSRPCQRCPEEDWDCFYYDVDNDNEESFDEDIDREETTPEEDEKPEETFPPETEESEPPEETVETSPTENWEEEPSKSLDLTEGEGSAYHTGVSISHET